VRGFANAVLRRLASEGVRPVEGDDDASIALRTGLDAWAVRELRRQLGDEVEPAAAALAGPARTTLRTNTCRTSVEELEESLRAAGLEVARGSIHGGSLVVSRAAPASLPGFHEGWFTVQDEASSFVVSALEPRPGERVLDACAGPGGKAGHLACLVGPGGRLIAADPLERRAGLVRSTLERLGTPGLVLVQDARAGGPGTVRPGVGRRLRSGIDRPGVALSSVAFRKDEPSALARLQAIVTSVADSGTGGRPAQRLHSRGRRPMRPATRSALPPDLEPVEIEA
jgi:16S rRNA (cytosine967-C5)-methyltransferase